MAIDPQLLLQGYASGVFPMAESRNSGEVFWVDPPRRAILPLDRFHLSKSLRKTLKSDRFHVTCDHSFGEVVRRCAAREETWINAEIEASYGELHRIGFAHSIEAWAGDSLVGGLYGVRLGRAFFGESMFSDVTDASKVALAWLVARLRIGGFILLDCQFMTGHLRSLGAIEVAQDDYLSLLAAAVGGDAPSAGAAGDAVAAAGEGAASFDALDELLAARAPDAAGAGVPPSGCVIAQLLAQTS